MKRLIKLFYIFIIINISCVTGFANADENVLESLKDDFVKKITEGMVDFKLEVITDKKDDKKTYLKKSLPEAYTPGDEAIDYKEIFIRPKNEKGFYHLGLISLTYSSCDKAKESFNRLRKNAKSKYFKNTKILTKYNILNRDNVIVVFYSETFIDKKVAEFYKGLTGKI